MNKYSAQEEGGWVWKSLVFVLVLFQTLQRPAILQAYGEVLGITILFLFLSYGLLGYPFSVTRQKLLFIGCTWLFSIYLWFQVVVSVEGVSRAALVNIAFIIVASATCLAITRKTWQSAIKAFVYIVLAFGVSYLTTTIIVFIGGIELSETTVFSFNLAQAGVEDRYLIPVYFPFSTSMNFGNVSFAGIPWARATGYMREPGLYQVSIIIAYFGIDYTQGLRWRKFWKGTLLLSLFLTFSTAGVGCFLAAALYYYVIARRDTTPAIKSGGTTTGSTRASRVGWGVSLISLVLIGIAGYWFVFSDQKFGLLRKLALGSGSARVEDIQAATEALIAHPLMGVGYTNSVAKGFSMLGVTGEIGIIGLVLFLTVLIVPLTQQIWQRDRILVLLVAPLLTALLSQPLFDKPLLYLSIALLVSYPYKAEGVEDVETSSDSGSTNDSARRATTS